MCARAAGAGRPCSLGPSLPAAHQLRLGLPVCESKPGHDEYSHSRVKSPLPFLLLLSVQITLLCIAPQYATAAPAAHEITRLPGWKGALPSKAYAGYIDAGTDTQVRAWWPPWHLYAQ